MKAVKVPYHMHCIGCRVEENSYFEIFKSCVGGITVFVQYQYSQSL